MAIQSIEYISSASFETLSTLVTAAIADDKEPFGPVVYVPQLTAGRENGNGMFVQAMITGAPSSGTGDAANIIAALETIEGFADGAVLTVVGTDVEWVVTP